MDKNSINHITQLIAKGRMKEAIQKATDLLDGTFLESDITLLSARFSSVMKSSRLGVISFDDETRETNKIGLSLLALLKELEENITMENPPAQAGNDASGSGNASSITGDGNINIQGISGSEINIHINKKGDTK